MPESPNFLLASYPAGSEWRRWDLHIHTPFSQLGSSFPGIAWSDYVNELESRASLHKISVVGVTDYMSIDGYERLVGEKNANGRLGMVDLLVPNIEFRIMPSTAADKALNLHVLIDPTDPEHVAQIKRALANLKFTYNGQTYGCERNQLIEFARVQRAGLTDDEAAYSFGIQQFKPDRIVLKQWIESEKWLRENALVGITNGKDGISGLPLDGFGAIRDELLRRCDFVFSGSPSDRKHYLGHKEGVPKVEILRQYGGLKPCVHGSDAHDIDRLFCPEQDRVCWIKADPTFQGLRQIVWEPEARIHIGKLPPQIADKGRIIKRIEFENANGWFSQNSIDLNPGLVAIIGEKGSGKTAIADLIAMAGGTELDPKSQSSFINKGRLHLSGLKVNLVWGNDTHTSATLPDTPFATARPRVRYLSQDFVERLCSSDHQGQELQYAIEEVIFAHLDEIQKEGYSSFSELRAARESSSNARRERFRGELATINKEIERLQNAIAQRPSKEKAKSELENQIAELQKQLPDATQTVDQNILQQLRDEQARVSEIEGKISSCSRRRRTISDARQKYSALTDRVSNEVEDLVSVLRDEGIALDVLNRFKPNWDPSVDGSLHAEILGFDSQVEQLKGNEEDPSGAYTLLATTTRLNELKNLISEDEVSRRRLLDLQKQISERTATAERLTKEIENLDKRVTEQLSQKEGQRLELYLKFFAALKEDENGLRDLYSPMQRAIDQIQAAVKFEIVVGFQIDFRPWLDKATRFFDGRRSGAEEKKYEIERFVEAHLASAWKTGDPDQVKEVFQQFIYLVDAQDFIQRFASQRLSLVELHDWLFSVDHIMLNYKIKYGGTELEYLSPGTRGIALLVLYLLMDEDDGRPLLIDQPEGNLDNSSVYEQLVPYIRQTKCRRQIILATHNPNLVVGTDAEQVIIATAERPTSQPYPRISYRAGSLEHAGNGEKLGVREAVCLLLEGGKEAFREREHRYSLPDE